MTLHEGASRAPRLAAEMPIEWPEVADELKAFDRVYKRVVGLRGLDHDALIRQADLVEGLAYAEEEAYWPSKPGTEFQRWLKAQAGVLAKHENKLNQDLRRAVRDAAFNLFSPPSGVHPNDFQVYDPKYVPPLIQAVQAYMDEINALMRMTGPAAFTYNGFNIQNPDRLVEDMLRPSLDAVDWLVALFKKRNIEPVIRATVDTVMISTDISSAGLYVSVQKRVVINPNAGTGPGKMLENWVQEVLLHEVGHHVHMTYMPAVAKDQWDSGWEHVDAAREKINDLIFVTSRDRHRFFELIERAGWDAVKAGRKVRGLDRLKYLMWLHKTQGNPLTSTPSQVRLNHYGKSVFEFFANRDKYLAEFTEDNGPDKAQKMLERRERAYMSTLGLTPWYDGKHHPMLDADTVAEIRANDTTVDVALDALGIPTQYGRTNVLEDFAETFVLFVTNPRALSKVAHLRMARALWLSGFAGKPVMRMAAKRVAARWLQASRLNEFLDGFFRRHPKLKQYTRGLRRIRESTGGSGSHGEARQAGNDILIFPKFWNLPPETQDFVLAHEIGHWVLSSSGGATRLLELARGEGVDLWDLNNLPFAQFNMDEGFADSFASYFTDGDVKRRYPQWARWVEAFL